MSGFNRGKVRLVHQIVPLLCRSTAPRPPLHKRSFSIVVQTGKASQVWKCSEEWKHLLAPTASRIISHHLTPLHLSRGQHTSRLHSTLVTVLRTQLKCLGAASGAKRKGIAEVVKAVGVGIAQSRSGWLTHLPPLARAVGVVSWQFSRSSLLPRVIGLLVGEATLSRYHVAVSEALYGGPALTSQSQKSNSLAVFLSTNFEVLVLLFRAIYLFLIFTPAVLAAPFADSFNKRFRHAWLRLVHRSLEIAGAAFIKWGQWAATRPDLFPKDLCDELAQLHTKAPAHSFEYTRQSIEDAFGRKVNEIFDDFEEEPVASGSIAQIHRATLKSRYPGILTPPLEVAVKVRHPGVSDVIRRDFVIMNWIAHVSSLLPGIRWLRLQDSVQQFAVFMLTQVDLAREAAHLSRFIYNFRRWQNVSFPKPLYPLVHPAVLVETFERGESVSRYVDRGGGGYINTELAHIGSHTLLKMLLVDNFIHADLHPGNILVRVQRSPNKASHLMGGHPHVVLLDVGMTAELSAHDRQTMLELFKAIALRDGRSTANCTLKFSANQSCPDPEAFCQEVEESFLEWDARGGRIPTGECMQELLEQVRKHRVNLDGNVCTVMITTLVLEGWQRKLDPDLSIMDTLNSILFKSEWAASFSYTIDGLMAP